MQVTLLQVSESDRLLKEIDAVVAVMLQTKVMTAAWDALSIKYNNLCRLQAIASGTRVTYYSDYYTNFI